MGTDSKVQFNCNTTKFLTAKFKEAVFPKSYCSTLYDTK